MVSPAQLRSPVGQKALAVRRSKTVVAEGVRRGRAKLIGGGDEVSEGAKVAAARPWRAKIGLFVVAGRRAAWRIAGEAETGAWTRTWA